MIEFSDHYEEEYVYLADVTEDAALIAWGKFFFDTKMRLVRDKDLHELSGQYGRHTSIGANCETYGPFDVEVRDAAGALVKTVHVADDTFTWVQGLKPDTNYRYRVIADPAGKRRVWGDGALYSYDPEYKQLLDSGRTYDFRFRTFPDNATQAPLTFAVIGDTGTGTAEQRRLAAALEALVDARDVRLVLMTGDTVYKQSGGSGNDDDEWLTTYYQPYRTLIDHVPFFPCVGNHDTWETPYERPGDTLTLYDNLLVTDRFHPPPPGRSASVEKGLFYRFRFGRDIEFICLDTSRSALLGRRMFERDPGRRWMKEALNKRPGAPAWRIPFAHHPPYCAGPTHGDNDDVRDDILPLCISNDIRVFFSGHEHNFQCFDSEDPQRRVRCVITGGGGKWRDDIPRKGTDGYMHSWGGNDGTHFLIVTIDRNTMTIEPITADGQPLPLQNRQGQPVNGPIEVTL